MKRSVFEFNNFVSEFQWVMDTLKSCKTLDQVRVASNLYNNFINKWSYFKEDFYEFFEKNRFEFELEKLKMSMKLS